MMSSRLVARCTLDLTEASLDAAAVPESAFEQSYREYAVGRWGIATLWNEPGRTTADVREHKTAAEPTTLGKQYGAINSVVRRMFNDEALRAVRLFSAENYALVIPHIDYLEHPNGFLRLHLPLITNDDARNSENNYVYHMNRGDLWFVDGRRVHSAGTLGRERRLHLVLDFDVASDAVDVIDMDLLVPVDEGESDSAIIARQPMTATELSLIHELANLASSSNWNDIVALIARLHFCFDIGAERLYDWLDEIAANSNQSILIARATEMRDIYVGTGPRYRQYGA